MKIVKVLFWILLIGHQISAQCPDRVKIWKELNETASLADNKTIIQNLIKLRATCQRCGMDNDSSYAKILHVLGRTYWYESDLENGITFTSQSIKINSSGKPGTKKMNLNASYFNLGSIYADKGDLENSILCFSKSIEIGKNYHERWFSVADGYQKQANIYNQTGDYEKSIAVANLGYEFGSRIADNERMAGNLTEKAQALIALLRFEEAESDLKKAGVLLSNTSDLSLKGFVFSKIGSLYKHRKNYSQAIQSYSEAFEFYKKSGFRYGCAQAANDLGYLYQKNLSNYSQAIRQYNLALKYCDIAFTKARIYNNIGSAYFLQNNFDEAFLFYQKALVIAPIGFTNNNIFTNPPGKLIRAATSKEYLLSLIQDKADTWLYYAKYKRNDKEKLKNALNTYMLADTMIDYMRWEHSGNVSKLFWRDKTRSMYEHAIETCYLLEDHAKAFYFFEKSRAVMLNDQLNELGASQLLSAGELEKERTLKQKITGLQQQLGEKTDEKNASEIKTMLFSVQEEQEKFIRHLEKTNPQYYAYKYDNAVLALPELRKEVLAHGQTFLSFFVGDSTVYGFSVSSKSVLLKKIDLRNYRTTVRDFQQLIADKEAQNEAFPKYLSVSSQLYQMLIKPFGIPAGSRVIISPDGSFLPFEALSKSSVTPQFLVHDHAFSYTYSAGYLAKSKRKAALPLSFYSFMGFAPVNFNPRLSQASLPGSDAVLRVIEQHFLSSVSLTGPAASRNTFLEKAPDYRIVQLLTHATADSTDTVPTLYFADSTLRLNELTSPRQSAIELLVLSACQTGLGKNQRGEGVFSLARGFAAVGIPSTLTTLWSVENNAVYDLTKLFYNGLREDLPLDIALQQAQIKWLNTGSKSNQLPYSWAGMVLVGNTEPVQTGWSGKTCYLFLGSVFLILGFLGFFLRRRFQNS